MKILSPKCAVFVLAIVALAQPAQPATIEVSSSTGVRDSNNVTPLVGNGLGGNSDYVQVIYSGPDAVIDPPQSDGHTTGDDVLLETEEFSGQFFTVIGEGFPFNPNEGKFLEDFKHALDTGARIYVRAWNASSPENATHYGDSALYTITNEFGEAHDFGTWSTDTVNVTQVQLSMFVFGQGTTSPAEGVHTFTKDSIVTVSATAAPGWLFTRWEGNLSGSVNPTTILMDQNKTVGAVFIEEPPDVFTVTTVPQPVEGGTIEPFQGSELFVEDEELTLTAVPNEGWLFDHWAGDLNSTDNPITFTVLNDVTAVAVFVVRPPDNYTLTMAVEGQGTTTPPVGDNVVPSNQDITLTATPAEDWLFVRWEGAVTTTENPTTLFMDGDKSMTAIFSQVPKSVLSTAIAGIGSIGLNPPGGIYDVGEVVMATASPAAGWRFDHWEGDVTGSENPIAITMNVNKSITAVFLETTGIRLTAEVQGQGSLSLDPPGGSYDEGIVVTVTAAPSPGWEFDHWEGDLAGSQNPSQITMNQDRIVRAVFIPFPDRTLTTQVIGDGKVNLLPTGGVYPHNTLVNVSAAADPGWKFDHWEGALSGNDNPKLLRLNADKNVVAVFTPKGGDPGCELLDVTVSAPGDGVSLFIPDGVSGIPYHVLAETSCLADTLRVAFELDGQPLQIDANAPFTATIADVTQLAPGQHALRALATAADGVNEVETTSTFNVVFTDSIVDADGNGIPDNPFTLLQDGDQWLSIVPGDEASMTRGYIVVLWQGGSTKQSATSVAAALSDPLHPSREVVVAAPRSLAQAGETAVLIVGASENLGAVVDGDIGSLLASQPSTGLLPGGQFVEISIIVSANNGATFDEIDNARLLAQPAHLSMAGFEFVLFGIETFFSYPTFVQGGTGLNIVAEDGAWDDDHTQNLEYNGDQLDADLTSLSVFGPFFRPQTPPEIQSVTPNTGSTEGGDAVIISGTGLNRPTQVTFGGIAGTIESSGDTDIIVTTPPNIEGVVDITVRTGGGSDTVPSAFTYEPPSEPAPVLTVSPLGHTFGLVPVGSTRTKGFLVQNTGGGQLTGEVFADAPFTVVSNGEYSLGPKEAQTVTIRFAPEAQQEYEGMLTFTGAGKLLNITVHGTGASPSATGPACAPGSGTGGMTPDIAIIVFVLAALARLRRLRPAA